MAKHRAIYLRFSWIKEAVNQLSGEIIDDELHSRSNLVFLSKATYSADDGCPANPVITLIKTRIAGSWCPQLTSKRSSIFIIEWTPLRVILFIYLCCLSDPLVIRLDSCFTSERTKWIEFVIEFQRVDCKSRKSLCKRVMEKVVVTHLLSSSMLKKTYSPLETMLRSWAANIISLIFLGPAHRTTTVNRSTGRIRQEHVTETYSHPTERHNFQVNSSNSITGVAQKPLLSFSIRLCRRYRCHPLRMDIGWSN